jgi:hypothetical protein
MTSLLSVAIPIGTYPLVLCVGQENEQMMTQMLGLWQGGLPKEPH